MSGRIRRTGILAMPVLALSLIAAPAALAAENDAPTRVWEVGGSNMGICSSFLGQIGARAEVNHLIKDFGAQLGIESPGALYRIRAQQESSLPPAQECLRRQF